MEQVRLNEDLGLSYPDGFQVMSAEELSKLRFSGGAPQWCISDPERHMILSISWKKVNGLVAKLLSAKDIAKDTEAKLSRPMKTYGYRMEDFFELELDGKSTAGFLYRYTVQGIGMSGKTLTVKNGRTIYYIYFYFRTAARKASLETLDEILDSVRWTGAAK
ncbi:MAG: hypothetical protein E7426_02235 [Ruminococcaceae bacterium]|jgi:hypothetical protein|nr:hypothetical protein [Oscillospiraceae bacterium]